VTDTSFTEEQFEEFVQKSLLFLRGVFEQFGSIAPVTLLLGTRDPQTDEPYEERRVLVVSGAFADEDDKDGYADAVRGLAAHSGAVAAVFAAESWRAELSPERAEEVRAQGLQIRDIPERNEVVAVLVERLGRKHVYGYCAAITRDAAGEPTLQEFEKDGDAHEGRFVHLLPTQN